MDNPDHIILAEIQEQLDQKYPDLYVEITNDITLCIIKQNSVVICAERGTFMSADIIFITIRDTKIEIYNNTKPRYECLAVYSLYDPKCIQKVMEWITIQVTSSLQKFNNNLKSILV